MILVSGRGRREPRYIKPIERRKQWPELLALIKAEAQAQLKAEENRQLAEALELTEEVVEEYQEQDRRAYRYVAPLTKALKAVDPLNTINDLTRQAQRIAEAAIALRHYLQKQEEEAIILMMLA